MNTITDLFNSLYIKLHDSCCIQFAILLLLQSFQTQIAESQSTEQNYIRTRTYTNSTGSKWIDQVDYYDGLGRQLQTVQLGVTPDNTNLASFHEYDYMGRKCRTWLPVSTSEDFLSPENFTATAAQTYNGDSRPYSETVYEPFLSDRVTEIHQPGNDLEGHPARTEYLTNTTAGEYPCYDYLVDESNNTVLYSGYYNHGRLFVTKSIDEDGREQYLYKDKMGKKILSREMCNGVKHDTYFVYDGMDRLRFVLQPMYEQDDDIDKYAFQYRYDGRGRCIWKKLPGCSPVTYQYGVGNQIVAMQDGLLRMQQISRFYLYDRLGRLAIQGTCAEYSGLDSIYVSFDASQNGFCGTGYTLPSNTNIINPVIETVEYYDDYSFLQLDIVQGLSNSSELTVQNPSCANGMKTGSLVKTDENRFLAKAVYYDDYGRKSREHQMLPNDVCVKDITAYSFTNKIAHTAHYYTNCGYTSPTVSYNTYYDNNDQLASTLWDTYDYVDNHLINYTYDNLGRLTMEKHTEDGITRKISYGYNLRGWLTDITSPWFNERIYYTDGTGIPYYSGNISSMQWKSYTNSTWRGYRYYYDDMNRLTDARYGEGDDIGQNKGCYDEKILGYNLNGSITHMLRYGKKNDNSFGVIDDLSLYYNGNQLNFIEDMAPSVNYTNAFDFKNGADEVEEYSYDGNGNLIYDKNKGEMSIVYNNIGLPQLITWSNGNFTKNIYDSQGNKLKTYHGTTYILAEPPLFGNGVVLNEGSTDTYTSITDSTIYLGRYLEYNGVEYRVKYDGGYMIPCINTDGSTYYQTYYYYVRDHLGNNRTVVGANSYSDQSTHYYPFGGIMGDISTAPNRQRYKFGGKEYDHTHGLDWFDFEARPYDPAIMQFTSVDPLAEKYYHLSPYAYCADNPVNAVDPDGRDYRLIFNQEDKTITIYAVYYTNANSMEYAKQSANILNSQSGIFNYQLKVGETKEKYTINFNIEVKVIDTSSYPNEMAGFHDILQKDNSGAANVFLLSPKLDKGVNGRTVQGNYIRINQDHHSIETGAHEIGHSLGLFHNNSGLMTAESSNPLRSQTLKRNDIKSIVSSPFKKRHQNNGPEGAGILINNTQYLKEQLIKGKIK